MEPNCREILKKQIDEYYQEYADIRLGELCHDLGKEKYESPLEELFHAMWLFYQQNSDDPFFKMVNLEYQYVDGQYRYDFYVSDSNGFKMAIEIDGYKFHGKDRKQFDNDRKRQNEIVKKGIIPYRITYTEMKTNCLCLGFDGIFSDIIDVFNNFHVSAYERSQK